MPLSSATRSYSCFPATVGATRTSSIAGRPGGTDPGSFEEEEEEEATATATADVVGDVAGAMRD
jgi:hypothetical protein